MSDINWSGAFHALRELGRIVRVNEDKAWETLKVPGSEVGREEYSECVQARAAINRVMEHMNKLRLV